MAGPFQISDIRDHLAWLRLDFGSCSRSSDHRRKLKYALLVYNAATLFEWYVTVSTPETPEFPYRKRDQGAAKKQANRFVMLVAKNVDRIRKAKDASTTKTAKPVVVHLGAVEDALDGFLNSLPPSFVLGMRPIRRPDLEMPVNPAELLAQRIGAVPVQSAGGESGGTTNNQQAANPLSPLMHAIGTVFTLEELKTTGKLLPEAHVRLRDVMAGYLADALGEAAESTSRSIARRLKCLEKQVAESIMPVARE
jgi:hypothetical protein